MPDDTLDHLDTRGLVLYNIRETRAVRKCLDGHLKDHAEDRKTADSRRWKVYFTLLGSFFATVGACVVALVVYL